MANKDSSGVRIDKKELKIAGEVVQGLLQKVPTFVLLIFRLPKGMEYKVRIFSLEFNLDEILGIKNNYVMVSPYFQVPYSMKSFLAKLRPLLILSCSLSWESVGACLLDLDCREKINDRSLR